MKNISTVFYFKQNFPTVSLILTSLFVLLSLAHYSACIFYFMVNQEKNEDILFFNHNENNEINSN